MIPGQLTVLSSLILILRIHENCSKDLDAVERYSYPDMELPVSLLSSIVVSQPHISNGHAILSSSDIECLYGHHEAIVDAHIKTFNWGCEDSRRKDRNGV